MMKRTIAVILSVLMFSTVLATCNTTHGVDEDTFDGDNTISGVTTKAQ